MLKLLDMLNKPEEAPKFALRKHFWMGKDRHGWENCLYFRKAVSPQELIERGLLEENALYLLAEIHQGGRIKKVLWRYPPNKMKAGKQLRKLEIAGLECYEAVLEER